MLIEAGQSNHVDAEKMTTGEYLDRWLESVKGHAKDNTFAIYSLAVKKFSPLIGRIPLQKLTALDITHAVKQVEQSGKLQAATVKAYLSAIRVALEQAVDWEFIAKNRARKVKSARYEQPETRFWTEDEAKLFQKNATTRRYYPLWYIALHTGLREGEMVELTWSDIDLEKKVIHVRRTATPYGINAPKSSAGKRIVPIDKETVIVIKKHRKTMMEETLRRGGQWNEDGFVFVSKNGKRLSVRACQDSFIRAVKSAVKASGVKDITFHGLGHTYATILLRRGVNVKKVAKILGHADVATTLNTYAHALPEDDEQVVQTIRQALGEE